MNELKDEFKSTLSFFPSVNLTPRTLVYVGIGWTAVALFWVWLPIVLFYIGFLILWYAGRFILGGVLSVKDVLESPKENKL